jgi:hypothetical protein
VVSLDETHGHRGRVCRDRRLVLSVAGALVGTDLGGPCPNTEGISPQGCPHMNRPSGIAPVTRRRVNSVVVMVILAAISVGFVIYLESNVKPILYTHTGPLPPPELRSPAPEWSYTP